MRKSLLSLIAIAAIIFTASCSKDDKSSAPTEKTSVTATLLFKESGQSRANSNAIPVTSWNSINNIALFLYDAGTGEIVYYDVVNPSSINTEPDDTKKITFANVPATVQGQTYKLALVANAQQGTDNIRTSVNEGTDYVKWANTNVFSKEIDLLRVVLPAGSQPSGSTVTGRTWLEQPEEVFTAYADNIQIIKDQDNSLPNELELRRDVSMMRALIDRKNADPEYDNSDVDFTKPEAFIRIDRMPEGMKISEGTSVLDAVNSKWSMNGGSFKTQNPTGNDYYSNNNDPVTILKDPYEFWNDIILFPNADRPANPNSPNYNVSVDGDDQYFIVVAGWAEAGHKLSNGKETDTDGLVFWSGTVPAAFLPNVIREVTLTLKTGGSTTEPIDPPTYGGLEIIVGEPLGWDENIQSSNVDM